MAKTMNSKAQLAAARGIRPVKRDDADVPNRADTKSPNRDFRHGLSGRREMRQSLDPAGGLG